jgi:hypothetical protein
VQIALVVALTCDAARNTAYDLSKKSGDAWDAIPNDYEARWQGAFAPSIQTGQLGNGGSNKYFSGNWPTLETDDKELARTYYGSLMSMLLVNKQGLDTDMQISKQPEAKAAGRCEGTFMPKDTVSGKTGPPLQLAVAARRNGHLVVHATQFAGRTNASWQSGTGQLSGSALTMAFDGGAARRGTVSPDCARIDWAAPLSGSAPTSWVRIRPAGRWNMFVAAGALLGNTAFYLWDTSGASLLWTLLDPDGIAIANNVFGTADPLLKNA